MTSSTVPESGWKRVEETTAPPYYVYEKPVRKSEQDDREYRVIRLENGLEAMLVHDGKADKAAASLDVAVGHLYDPVSARLSVVVEHLFITLTQDDMPGLAHFCEHLLFMVRKFLT